jgi:hypothetical protein
MNKKRFAKYLFPMWLGMAAVPAMAVDEMWTGVGSTCTLDEASTALAEMNAARLYFKPNQTGTIVARCNVTNPHDDGGDTHWNRLEVAYRDNDGALSPSPGVIAILYRVSSRRAPPPKGNGGISEIARFNSDDYPENADTVNSVDFEVPHEFNFDRYTYFVELRIRRDVAVAGINVSVSAIRLLE